MSNSKLSESLHKKHLEPVLERYFSLPIVVSMINNATPPEKARYFSIQFTKGCEGYIECFDKILTTTNDAQEIETIKSFKQNIVMMKDGSMNELMEKFKMTKEELDKIFRAPISYWYGCHFESFGSFEEVAVGMFPGNFLFGELMNRTVAAGKDPKMTADFANMIVGMSKWFEERVDKRVDSFDAAKLKKLENIYKVSLNFEFMWMESIWNQQEWYLKNLPVQ